jgi:hypothetical protein
MFARHPSDRLAAYCDGQLPALEARAIESHLATCGRCRRECDDVRFAAAALRELALSSPPQSVWNALDRQLREARVPVRAVPRWRVSVAAAASLALLVATGALYRLVNRAPDGPWQVATEQAGRSEAARPHGPGDWVETTPASRARILVGSIGTVEVEPNARVQLGAVTPSQYRLSVERGTISAEISAPPRMFIVDTPATTVVDLGCAYTVTVGLDGAMELRMTSGWAALEWEGTETLVPAGARSRTRKGHRPGLPYFDDAPSALQQAIGAIDLNGVTDELLARVLATARERDTLTLWHLLPRTAGGQRDRVFDRLQALVPMPAGVTQERVTQLDPDALRTWREELAWHW